LAYLNPATGVETALQGKDSHVSWPIILLSPPCRTNRESVAVRREIFGCPKRITCIVAIDTLDQPFPPPPFTIDSIDHHTQGNNIIIVK
jgi:hypothetical protein